MNKLYYTKGFSLIELGIVLIIIGVLIGSFVGALNTRIENSRRNEVVKQLNIIKEAVIGFAVANGRLPCPADTNTNGDEDPVGGGECFQQHGFVPGRLLGIPGRYNQDNILMDVWNNPIRYSVTDSDGDAFTETPGAVGSGTGMRGVGISNLDPDLHVCNEDSTSDTTCTGTATIVTLASEAPFVIISLGKDGSQWASAVPVADSDQKENSGEALTTANAAGENIAYLVGDNDVFVSRSYTDVGATAGYYDDIVVWESPFILYSRMIQAGTLP